eukprot:jgi/Tetstr1/420956/TSEL_012016.t1
MAGRSAGGGSLGQFADALSVAGVAAGAAGRRGGVGWGVVDHLSDVDMEHMPAEISMETAVPIDFQEAWAEAQRCVNERVVAAVEADDPVALDRALKWKDMLPQLLLGALGRGAGCGGNKPWRGACAHSPSGA